MDISVVIACYNGAGTLFETLEAIARQQYDKEWEVVFSDNGSTDNSRAIAESFIDTIPILRIVDSSAERGQPFALNNGTENSNGQAVIYCDTDDVPLEGWLAAMGEALKEHDIVACRTDTSSLNSEWQAASRNNIQGERLQKVNYPPYLYHAAGATLGIKKKLHKQLGGFDSEFPLLHDTDFCFKAQLAGHEIKFVESAVLCYRFRTSFKGIFRQAKGYGAYNIRLAKKYRSTGVARPHRWRRFYGEIKRLIRYYLSKDNSNKENAIFYRRLGWTLGRLEGVIRYRFPPH